MGEEPKQNGSNDESNAVGQRGPTRVSARLRELLSDGFGEELSLIGRQRANAHAPGAVGQILHAHLLIESALRRYIEAMNPGLGSLEKLKLRFGQLMQLYKQNEHAVPQFTRGIEALNKVRNAVAHDLDASKVAAQHAQPMLDVSRMLTMLDRSRSIIDENEIGQVCLAFAVLTSALLGMIRTGRQDLQERERIMHEKALRFMDEMTAHEQRARER